MSKHPTVGALVHLVDAYPPYVCLAAIVTRVPDGYTYLADLAVFNRGLDFKNGISFEESGSVSGTWHWMEHEEET